MREKNLFLSYRFLEILPPVDEKVDIYEWKLPAAAYHREEERGTENNLTKKGNRSDKKDK